MKSRVAALLLYYQLEIVCSTIRGNNIQSLKGMMDILFAYKGSSTRIIDE